MPIPSLATAFVRLAGPARRGDMKSTEMRYFGGTLTRAQAIYLLTRSCPSLRPKDAHKNCVKLLQSERRIAGEIHTKVTSVAPQASPFRSALLPYGLPGAGRFAAVSSMTSTQSLASGGRKLLVPEVAKLPISPVAPEDGLNHQQVA